MCKLREGVRDRSIGRRRAGQQRHLRGAEITGCVKSSPGVTFKAQTQHGVHVGGLNVGTSSARAAWLTFDGIDADDFAVQGNTSTQQTTSHITINHMKVTTHVEADGDTDRSTLRTSTTSCSRTARSARCVATTTVSNLSGSQPGNDFVTFDHVNVHDVVGGDASYGDNLIGCDHIPTSMWSNCRATATPFAGNHVDCLQILSAGNFTISNSRFVNCWNAGNLQNGILNGSEDWNWTISNLVFEGSGSIGEYETEFRTGGSPGQAFLATDPDTGSRVLDHRFVGGIVMDSTTAQTGTELTAVGNIFGAHLSSCNPAGFAWTRFDYNLVTASSIKGCYPTSVVGGPSYANISSSQTAAIDAHLKAGSLGDRRDPHWNFGGPADRRRRYRQAARLRQRHGRLLEITPQIGCSDAGNPYAAQPRPRRMKSRNVTWMNPSAS